MFLVEQKFVSLVSGLADASFMRVCGVSAGDRGWRNIGWEEFGQAMLKNPVLGGLLVSVNRFCRSIVAFGVFLQHPQVNSIRICLRVAAV